jgi:hypothetical protein
MVLVALGALVRILETLQVCALRIAEISALYRI